ncbi:MAG: DUF1232 domain-containing protein [Desulfobacteraceae bacterium]|nr:DUF1232 domain-containing protein [Desulfobacteraceae bacterium]
MTQKKYEKFYTEKKFWSKIKDLPTAAPFCILLRTAISLYLLLKESSVSLAAKSLIAFSLGYFICPIDFLPDFAPFGIGLSDDMALMAMVLTSVYCHLNKDIQEKVQDILPEICKGEIEFNPTTETENINIGIKNKINGILNTKK